MFVAVAAAGYERTVLLYLRHLLSHSFSYLMRRAYRIRVLKMPNPCVMAYLAVLGTP